MEVCYQESNTLSEQQNRLDAAFDVLFEEVARREEVSPQTVVLAELTSMHI
jgi:hypothetical protein